MSADTKQCPSCGAQIEAEARICRSCSARFEVTIKGYCPTCHGVVQADENGACRQCGETLFDRRVESTPLPMEASASQSQSAPALLSVVNPAQMGYSQPGSFIDRQLRPGEQVFYRTRLHWTILFNLLLGLVGIVILFGLAEFSAQLFPLAAQEDEAVRLLVMTLNALIWFSRGLALFLLLLLIWRVIGSIRSQVAVTDQRILGWIGRLVFRRVDIPLDDVAELKSWRGPSVLFNYGTVSIRQTNGKRHIFTPLPRPELFVDQVLRGLSRGARPVVKKSGVGKAILSNLLALLIIPILVVGALLLVAYLAPGKYRPSLPAGGASIKTSLPAGPQATRTPAATQTPRPSPTIRPTRTPTPAPVEVDFATIGELEVGRKVIFVGRLDLPGSTYCGEQCGLFLENPADPSQKVTIFIDLPLAGSTPAPSQMKPLPDPYKKSDIQVRLNDGTYAFIGFRVRITGRVCETTGGEVCVSDITSIDLVTVK